jgi:hypothetical protein
MILPPFSPNNFTASWVARSVPNTFVSYCR